MLPVSRLIKKRMMNTTNSTCAIHADVPAMPENPVAAAISATTKNMSAQYNMTFSSCLLAAEVAARLRSSMIHALPIHRSHHSDAS
jgi:hypothetical protein